MRSVVAGIERRRRERGLDERAEVSSRPARRRSPRLVSAMPRPLRTNSGAPTAVVSRRSAALMADWVR